MIIERMVSKKLSSAHEQHASLWLIASMLCLFSKMTVCVDPGSVILGASPLSGVEKVTREELDADDSLFNKSRACAKHPHCVSVISAILVLPFDSEWTLEMCDDALLDVLSRSSDDGVSNEALSRLILSAGMRSDSISFGV
jgi:hypothetical protein